LKRFKRHTEIEDVGDDTSNRDLCIFKYNYDKKFPFIKKIMITESDYEYKKFILIIWATIQTL
jgi:hypothetical protein